MSDYAPVTVDDLATWFKAIRQFIVDEKRMRERVLRPGRARDAKLNDCDEAIAALVALKDFAKQHAEASPVQESLFDTPAAGRRGGY